MPAKPHTTDNAPAPAAPLAHAAPAAPPTEPEPTFAARILREEAAAIAGLTPLEPAFFEAAGLIEQCARSGGSVLITGLGKSGLIGAKIAATFSSLGIPAHSVHPTEAVHGDLGRFRPCDTVLALSFSGETDEVVNLAAILRQDGLPIISITGGRGGPEVRGQKSEVRGQESGVRGQESAEGSPGAQAPGGWTPDAHQTPEVGGQTPPTPERKLGMQPRRGDQSLAPGAGSEATQPGESRSYSAEPRRGEGSSETATGATNTTPTNNHTSSLERLATAALHLNLSAEAGAPDFAAPTSSTTATLALGDTLGLCVARRLGLTDADFRKRHPGGALGGLLRPITEALRYRAGENLPAARPSETVAEALAHAATIGRRPGAIVVVDDGADGKEAGTLAGIFTDGDLRRLILRDPGEMQRPIGEVMTRSPRTLPHTALVRDAVRMVREFRQDEIPIVDEAGRPVGVLDVQDLVALRLVTE